MIRRLLIANRGEIAIRIARGARELGIEPVGVYSDADARALFREALDAAVRIGPGPAGESYLDITAILTAARALGADAIHPGYGFLSERAPFAQAVVDAGLIFVGPAPATIAAMGSKSEAKRLVRAAGVPVVAGYDGVDDDATLRREAAALGVPLVIKAVAGGGGRGMRVVDDLAAFDDALAAARREARASFGDDVVLLERYLRRPRHIEFQILGDAFGTIVHVGERECSIQRRHQKVVEEAPSAALDDDLRARMGTAAVTAARSVNYTNAGTVEFLLDDDGTFAFLEMNARLQVEHPVTEMVYGIDLVHEQLRIAAGEPLRFAQADVVPRAWAIEVRLNADDPAHDDAPQSGTLDVFSVPEGPGVRLDTGVRSGSVIPPFYDSLLAKIIVHGDDRASAIACLRETLAHTITAGIATNLPLLRAIASDDAFACGDTTTRFLEERGPGLRRHIERDGADAVLLASVALAAAGYGWRPAGAGVPIALVAAGARYAVLASRTTHGWHLTGDVSTDAAIEHDEPLRIRTNERSLAGTIRRDERGVDVAIPGATYRFAFVAPPSAQAAPGAGVLAGGSVNAPMPGKIVALAVRAGDRVQLGQLLVVLEAMKMEHRIEAPAAGTIDGIHVAPGDVVPAGLLLVTIGTA